MRFTFKLLPKLITINKLLRQKKKVLKFVFNPDVWKWLELPFRGKLKLLGESVIALKQK